MGIFFKQKILRELEQRMKTSLKKIKVLSEILSKKKYGKLSKVVDFY